MDDKTLGPWIPEDGDRPGAVVEAEAEVRRLGWTLAGTGVGGSVAYWLHILVMGYPIIPMSWWGLFLVALVLSFFFPQTRRAQRAREVLRQWDGAQVRALLERSGSSTDPRLRSAERMVHRIQGHPGAGDELRNVASELLERLRDATRDQRVIEVMLDAGRTGAAGPDPGVSLPDLADYLEARAGRLLGALAELHGAMVKRDRAEIAQVLEEASDVLLELRASEEVDRILDGDDGD